MRGVTSNVESRNCPHVMRKHNLRNLLELKPNPGILNSRAFQLPTPRVSPLAAIPPQDPLGATLALLRESRNLPFGGHWRSAEPANDHAVVAHRRAARHRREGSGAYTDRHGVVRSLPTMARRLSGVLPAALHCGLPERPDRSGAALPERHCRELAAPMRAMRNTWLVPAALVLIGAAGRILVPLMTANFRALIAAIVEYAMVAALLWCVFSFHRSRSSSIG